MIRNYDKLIYDINSVARCFPIGANSPILNGTLYINTYLKSTHLSELIDDGLAIGLTTEDIHKLTMSKK